MSATGTRSVDVERLTGVRLGAPQQVAERWQQRQLPTGLPDDGRLMIVAADHPARGALAVRGQGDAMADRADMLSRLVSALRVDGVDGVLGTADVLDDLLLLDALEGKQVFGSMNRGGLAGTAFELDDRFTGYRAPTLAQRQLQGGKMLLRIDPDDPASVATLEACAAAVDALAEHRLLAMVEPFWSTRVDGRVVNQLDPDSVIKSIHIASALGSASEYTWLKLPVTTELERVMAATTMPSLILGGDPMGAPEETFALWRDALAIPQVRGLVIGRALLYPAGNDVEAAVSTAATMVRGA